MLFVSNCSHIIHQYQFDKETGLLSEVTKADGIKYYADYDSLLKNNHFKQEISDVNCKIQR